jgi:hypothetical protein
MGESNLPRLSETDLREFADMIRWTFAMVKKAVGAAIIFGLFLWALIAFRPDIEEIAAKPLAALTLNDIAAALLWFYFAGSFSLARRAGSRARWTMRGGAC